MKFRFGWRKKQKRDHLDVIFNGNDHVEFPEDLPSTDNDLDSEFILNGQPSREAAMTTRILVFGDHEKPGNLYSLFLRSKGYEVFNFPSPATCALVARQACTCPREHVCADILIADMDMEGMTGLELIRHQRDCGCLVLPGNKAVLSARFTNRQEYDATALGCKTLQKPFRLLDMMEWVRRCEESIPPDRKLIPHNELLETSRSLVS